MVGIRIGFGMRALVRVGSNVSRSEIGSRMAFIGRFNNRNLDHYILRSVSSTPLLLAHRRRPFSSANHPIAPQELNKKPPGRLKLFYQQYGKPGIIVYLTISTLDLLLAWGTVEFLGVDMESITAKVTVILDDLRNRLGVFPPVPDVPPEGVGENPRPQSRVATPSWMKSFLIGYAFHKILMPIRVPITAAITPWFARWSYRTGLLKMPQGMPAPVKGHTRAVIKNVVSDLRKRKARKGKKGKQAGEKKGDDRKIDQM